MGLGGLAPTHTVQGGSITVATLAPLPETFSIWLILVIRPGISPDLTQDVRSLFQAQILHLAILQHVQQDRDRVLDAGVG